MEDATLKVLAEEKIVTGSHWESLVTEEYITIPNYTLKSDEQVTIQIRKDTDDPTVNIITFFYTENRVTIKYEVVGPNGCGTVNPESESIKISTGTANGSAATASSSVYKFVGWYLDEDGMDPVPADWVDANGKIVPQKTGDLWMNATYYAKFEYNLTSLTINKVTTDKSGNPKDYTSVDDNQTFIFDIYDGNTLVTTVTVHAGTNWKIVIDGLTVGKTYRIVERTDWSWRYGNASWTHDDDGDGNVEAQGTGNTATIIIGVNGTITFTNERNEDKWLDGDSWCDNIFKN